MTKNGLIAEGELRKVVHPVSYAIILHGKHECDSFTPVEGFILGIRKGEPQAKD